MIHRSVKVSCNNLSWTSSWGCVAWQQKQTTQILAASSHPQKPHKEVYPDNKREPPLLLFIHRTCLRRVRKLLQSKKRSLLTRSRFFKIAKRFLYKNKEECLTSLCWCKCHSWGFATATVTNHEKQQKEEEELLSQRRNSETTTRRVLTKLLVAVKTGITITTEKTRDLWYQVIYPSIILRHSPALH